MYLQLGHNMRWDDCRVKQPQWNRRERANVNTAALLAESAEVDGILSHSDGMYQRGIESYCRCKFFTFERDGVSHCNITLSGELKFVKKLRYLGMTVCKYGIGETSVETCHARENNCRRAENFHVVEEGKLSAFKKPT